MQLTGLTVAVLSAHLWLLGGMPKVFTASKPVPTFIARTVETLPQPPLAPVRQAAPTPAAAPHPASPAPRKQSVAPDAPRTRAIASAPAVAPAASEPQVIAKAEPPAPRTTTSQSGASRASAFALLPSAHYNYEVIALAKGIELRGTARLDWRVANGEYEAQLSMKSPIPFVKSRTQRSVGLVSAAGGLAPVRFSDKTRSEEATHFDRENNRVVFSTNKPEAALEPGAQDRLSIVLQLGAMLAGAPSKFPAGTEITVQTASTKEAEPWTFTVHAPETLDLPGGRMQAVRLTRNPRREYDVKVELWLAPGAAYAPVRLRLTQPNGDWVDQQWSSTDRG